MGGGGGGALNKRECPTDNLNINKREGPNKKGEGVGLGLKIVLGQKWKPVRTNCGIASAKSRSAREESHRPAFMGNCRTISHTCLPLLHF